MERASRGVAQALTSLPTADLCDLFGDLLQYVSFGAPSPGLVSLGGEQRFHGPVRTVQCLEDNSAVKAALNSAGNGHVLVVDGGGSMQRALVGDQIAQSAVDNGWAGVVVHGCVRDCAALRRMPLGVMALGAIPRKTEKRGVGAADVPVHFGNVRFEPVGMYLVADEDGVVVCKPDKLPPVPAAKL